MTEALGPRFREALAYAAELHASQTRKGTAVPYVGHLLAVAATVIEDGGSEDEAIAALLHDAAEDQGGEPVLAEIRARFGDGVAGVVAECSDTFVTPKPPWRERKEAHVAHLATASEGAVRVSLADKLHNARAIVRDLQLTGPALWDRFSAGRDEQLWYYGALADAFAARRPGVLAGELRELVMQMASARPRPLYAAPREVASVADCHFYHVMDLPGVGTVGGDWDLRGREAAYLGGVELAGRRVLEIGPANGSLSFWMEGRGAEVVAVELAPDEDWDMVPHARLDLDAIRRSREPVMERLRNGFWFAHARLGSRVRVHYGSAYAVPEALGRFDVAVMAAVLLHTRDPLRIVEGCARRADTVVITDLHVPELDGAALARLEPAADSDNWDTWWRMSPELLTRFLAVLGHGEADVTFHEQTHIGGGASFAMPMFTVVARRG